MYMVMIRLSGGVLLVDRFHSKAELILALCVGSCAALNAIVPYSLWIELFYVIFLLEGWMEVVVNVGKHVCDTASYNDTEFGQHPV